MIICKNNIEAITELYLHDMELLDISINYSIHKVEISLKEQQQVSHILLFEHIQSFSIESFEPWGKGVYVSEIKVTTPCRGSLVDLDDGYIIDDEAFMVEIILNSGDKIRVLSTKMQFV